VCRLVSFEGDKKVADIKLPYIQNIAEQASTAKNINRIMLFGSATEERCTERSDIDIAVFGDLSKTTYLRSKEFKQFQDRVFLFDLDQDYDILYFSEKKKNHDPILYDIYRGTEIYRREEV
jgi:predicted nucleotidyltransferase